MEPITVPSIAATPITTAADSGIMLPPSANLLTTDSSSLIPSFSNMNMAAGSLTKNLDGHASVSAIDTGYFKTPLIPTHQLLPPATTETLSTVEEHKFQSRLQSRTLDVSTPLSTLDPNLFLQQRKTVAAIAQRTEDPAVDHAPAVTAVEERPLQVVRPQSDPTIAGVVEDIITVQTLELPPPPNAVTVEEINVPTLETSAAIPIQSQQQQQPPQPLAHSNAADDDYRKDWYEILRARLQNVNYENAATKPKRKPKYRRPNRTTHPLTEETQLAQRGGAAEEQQPQPSSSNLLQQTLAEILPAMAPIPPLPSSPPQNINISADFSETITSPQQQQQQQQQQYDQFIIDNVENIETIMDNLDNCRTMLNYHRRGIQERSAGGTLNQPRLHYDPAILLKASKKSLAVKLGILQNIIRQVSFDFTKIECVRDRMDAAIGFAFLLQLKSAGIITLSADGRSIALCYNGERRNGGFGSGRGRGGGGRGGRDSGDRPPRREFNNNKGENDEYNNSGGDGEEPQKPREFYIPPEPTDNEDEIFGSGITSGINFSKYDSIPVKVTGENAPTAILSFEEAGLRDIVLNNVKRSGYSVPTPIQKSAIPVIAGGRDLMACAQTGSGKTAAFLLPIINSLLSEGAETSIGKPHALIVSPTRELAIQIFNEARKFAMGSYLNIRIVYGGTSSKHQGENIGKGGSHILICTPGRLLDFVEKTFISFEETRFVVLDEADRMLDMGFKESVATIMNHPTMRPVAERQNLMFSATFPAEIQRMAGEYLNEYIFISVGVVGGACTDVTQNIYEVKKSQKRAKLMELLQENPDGTIVFVETKRGADFLASLLSETEFPTTSIHGDRLQRQREMALADFKSGKMKVLIATSVAARGLDIKNVNHVVNYDMPQSIDEYVHRIGRTGRVGNNGRATSFFDPENDTAIAGDLVNILEGAGQAVPDFLKNCGGGGGGDYHGGSKFGGRDVRKGIAQNDDNYVTSSGPSALEEDEDWN